jgi:hypothetical protein
VNTKHFIIGSFVVDYGGEGQLFKHVIHALEDTIWVVDILTESTCTFLTKA